MKTTTIAFSAASVLLISLIIIATFKTGIVSAFDSDGHPVDPSTGKYPDNVPSSEVNSRTHVPLPPGANLPPGPYTP